MNLANAQRLGDPLEAWTALSDRWARQDCFKKLAKVTYSSCCMSDKLL